MSRDIREAGMMHKALTAPCHHRWLKEMVADGMMAELGRMEVGGQTRKALEGGGRMPMHRRSHIIPLHRMGILASGTLERTFRGLRGTRLRDMLPNNASPEIMV